MMINFDDLSPEQLQAAKSFKRAVNSGEVETLNNAYSKFPQIFELNTGLEPWVCMAARNPSVAILKDLYRLGANPNARSYGGEDGSNALGCAASAGLPENVRYLLSIGTEIDQTRPTRDVVWSAILGRSPEVMKILLDEGLDSAVRYDGYPGPYKDALSFALERGEREIARLIALHQADGDTADAQRRLTEAWEVMKLNNPHDDGSPYLPAPMIDGSERLPS